MHPKEKDVLHTLCVEVSFGSRGIISGHLTRSILLSNPLVRRRLSLRADPDADADAERELDADASAEVELRLARFAGGWRSFLIVDASEDSEVSEDVEPNGDTERRFSMSESLMCEYDTCVELSCVSISICMLASRSGGGL